MCCTVAGASDKKNAWQDGNTEGFMRWLCLPDGRQVRRQRLSRAVGGLYFYPVNRLFA